MENSEKYPSQLAERFQIRLPDGMRERIRVAAEENKRSMNAEIIARLEADPATTEPNLEYERCKIELKHCKETCEFLEKSLAENNDRFWQLARLFESHNEIFIDNTNILISLLNTIKERGEKEGSVEPALVDSCLSIVKMLVKLNVKNEIP